MIQHKHVLHFGSITYGTAILEVFHVYLNKFENAVTHLFLVI